MVRSAYDLGNAPNKKITFAFVKEMNQRKGIVVKEDLVKVFAILLSNWYLLFLIPTLFYSGSMFYTHRLQEIYAAKCQILLKAQETYDYQQQLNRGLGLTSGYGGYEYTAGQMRVIKTSTIIERVTDSLTLSVKYFILGRLKQTEVYNHIPFEVHFDEGSSKGNGISFSFKFVDDRSYQLRYELNDELIVKTYQFDELVLDNGLYLTISKSRGLKALQIAELASVNYQFELTKRDALVDKYKKSLSVKNLEYTSVIELTLEDEIPERAVEILEALAKIYIETTVQSQLEVNANTLNYIDKQINEVVGIINAIEFELEDFKEHKEVLNLEREENAYFDRLMKLEEEKRMLELNQESMNDLKDYLLSEIEISGILPPSSFINEADGSIERRVTEIYSLRSEYNLLLEGGTSLNPRINSLLLQMEQVKNDLLRYIDNEYKASASRFKDINRAIGELEYKIKGIPKTQREVLNIQRRLEVNEKLYSYLLSKRAETVIAKAGLLPETKVIEKPRAAGVVYPNKEQSKRLSLLIGLGLALIIILIKEFFFQKITSIGQLQTNTSLSILGSIPKKKDLPPTYRLVSANDKGEIIQSFRSLRTNVQYFNKEGKCQKIMVTSLLPGEGKTFSSVNLASILALAEKRVLIIDFDLHKPRLNKALELNNEKGVSSFLIGKHSIEDVLQKTEIDSLRAITSGPVPPNASELVLRNEVDELLNFAEANFDYVLIDTPPISLISDGLLLMQKCDLKVFVLNSKSTTRSSLNFIEKLISENNIIGASLILNEEKRTRMSYYYSKYGYGNYGYGNYGYGNYGYGE